MNHQPQYGKASYWDDRYTKDPEIFDWYQVRCCCMCACDVTLYRDVSCACFPLYTQGSRCDQYIL